MQHISPSKTLEGVAAAPSPRRSSGRCSCVALGRPGLRRASCSGCVLAFAAQAGDLAESMLKRAAGAKESGHLDPGPRRPARPGRFVPVRGARRVLLCRRRSSADRVRRRAGSRSSGRPARSAGRRVDVLAADPTFRVVGARGREPRRRPGRAGAPAAPGRRGTRGRCGERGRCWRWACPPARSVARRRRRAARARDPAGRRHRPRRRRVGSSAFDRSSPPSTRARSWPRRTRRRSSPAGHLVMPPGASARRGASRRRAGRPAGAVRSAGCGRSTRSTRRSGSASSARTSTRVERLILTASGGPFLDTAGRGVRRDHAGAGPPAPDVADGREGHDRLRDPREQGPGGHRGTLALRCRLRADRRRDPSAVGRPLRRPVRGRLTQGPAGNARHATADPIRPDAPRSPALAGRRGRTSSRTARLDFRAPDEARFPALRIAREAGRLGPRATAALIAADDVAVARFLDGSLDFPGIPRLLEAAVARFGTAGGADPSLDEVLALDAEVPRAASPPCRSGVARLMDGLIYALVAILLFIVILGGLVLVHELGHYVTAKALDVRVLEFGIGFPPRARVLRSRGETLWTLNWLPIGGFVRMEGEDGDAADDPRVVLGQAAAGSAWRSSSRASSSTSSWRSRSSSSSRCWRARCIGVRIGEIEAGSPAAARRPRGRRPDLRRRRRDVRVLRRPTASRMRCAATPARRSSSRSSGADGSAATISATLRPREQLSDDASERSAFAPLEQVYSGGYVGHDPGRSLQIASTRLARWGGLIVGGLGALVDGFIKDPTAPPPASGPVGHRRDARGHLHSARARS